MTDYKEAREKIITEVNRSNPSCDMKIECWTQCGKCGADRILNLKWPDGSPMIGVIATDQSELENPFEGYIDVAENIRMAKSQGWLRAMDKVNDANFRRLAEKEVSIPFNLANLSDPFEVRGKGRGV